jgi:hypothetical protein
MEIFSDNIRFEVNQDFDLMNIISHPLIQNNYNYSNNVLISKDLGNRRPILRISFIEVHENNSKFIEVSIVLTSAIKRLINAALFVATIIGVLIVIHLSIFEFPILLELANEIRIMIYLYPLLVIFSLVIYYLSYKNEVSEFEKIFRVVIRMNSKMS